jgi:hypothetical protein
LLEFLEHVGLTVRRDNIEFGIHFVAPLWSQFGGFGVNSFSSSFGSFMAHLTPLCPLCLIYD